MTDEPNAQPPAVPIAPRDQVIQWLLEGHSDAHIRQAIATVWPEHNPDKLAESAVEHFEAAAACDPKVIVGWALEAYRHLYQKSIQIGDFAGAMKAVKELVAIATKHVHNEEDEDEASEEDGQSEEHPAEQAGGASTGRSPEAPEPSPRQERRDPAVRRPRKKSPPRKG